MSPSDMHVSDEQLAAAAVGDQLTALALDHLASCDECQERHAQWTRLVQVGESTSRADVPSDPPERVWEGIANELTLDEAGSAEPIGQPAAEVVVLKPRRRRWTTPWLVAATLVGVIAGGALTAVGATLMDDSSEAPVASPVVAQTNLAALPDKQGAGTAEIVDTAAGKELVVDVSDLEAGDGFFEVWLIDPKTFQMVGLGALTDTQGRFPIPQGLDLTQYRVVDVSLEPMDGDPAHSRDSLVRGELDV